MQLTSNSVNLPSSAGATPATADPTVCAASYAISQTVDVILPILGGQDSLQTLACVCRCLRMAVLSSSAWGGILEREGLLSVVTLKSQELSERRSKGRVYAGFVPAVILRQQRQLQRDHAFAATTACTSTSSTSKTDERREELPIVRYVGAELKGSMLHVCTQFHRRNLRSYWRELQEAGCLSLGGGRFLRWGALRLLEGLLTSLRFLHKRGVLHRNIKPDNILLSLPGDAHPRVAFASISKEAAENCLSAFDFFDSTVGAPCVKLSDLAMGRLLDYKNILEIVNARSARVSECLTRHRSCCC
ncbi:hypothetical protein cyc_02479 [Cyclospora cayetanensis]|uniref:Protein kinase domain-containing protein n=1 Tax=Cyclospora cayetanensis TaxID=88456 RepID=A0A1D3D417_9EIME|nr:hypothetical protein cyc_02479 [Cyclospora cayetanensis]